VSTIGKLAQAADRVGAVALEHRGEERLRRAPNDRRCFEGMPRYFVLDVLEIDPRELVDHASQRRVLERELRVLGHPGGREHEREWMAARDLVQPRSLGPSDTVVGEQCDRVLALERSERHAPESLEPEPAGDRALTATDHEADAVGQSGNEHLSQPGVHEAKDLVVVEREHCRSASQVVSQGLDALEISGGGEEAPLGGLNGTAVEGDDLRSGALCELGQQLGLANAGNAVERRDSRRPAVGKLEQGSKLCLAAEERPHDPRRSHCH
jgi:hypothetical protein